LLERVKVCLTCESPKLGLKAAEIPEGELIHDTDESVKLKKGVLERSGRQQNLLKSAYGAFDGVRYLIARFVYVPKAMGLVDND
jgi:hypothetical protein